MYVVFYKDISPGFFYHEKIIVVVKCTPLIVFYKVFLVFINNTKSMLFSFSEFQTWYI